MTLPQHYLKYSPLDDRWISWHPDTGEHYKMSPEGIRRRTGWSEQEEYYYRFGVRAADVIDVDGTPGLDSTTNPLTGRQEGVGVKIDTNIDSNSALYWPGENLDAAAGRYYSRPVPESAAERPHIPGVS